MLLIARLIGLIRISYCMRNTTGEGRGGPDALFILSKIVDLAHLEKCSLKTFARKFSTR